MAKQNGLGAGLYVAGYDVSNDIRDVGRIGGGPSPLDKTGIDKSAFERIGGVKTGEITLTAHFNPAANRAHDVLGALPTASQLVTYRQSATIGGDAASIVGPQVNYDPTRANDGDLTATVQYLSSQMPLEWGTLLTAGTRTDTGATNGTGWDGAASTDFGAQFYLHVTAFTGTDVTIKVQDSADNATFADLTAGAFTAVTAGPTSQWITTARDATVRRYLRVATVTTGGFTSVSFVVVAVKNVTAVTL